MPYKIPPAIATQLPKYCPRCERTYDFTPLYNANDALQVQCTTCDYMENFFRKPVDSDIFTPEPVRITRQQKANKAYLPSTRTCPTCSRPLFFRLHPPDPVAIEISCPMCSNHFTRTIAQLMESKP